MFSRFLNTWSFWVTFLRYEFLRLSPILEYPIAINSSICNVKSKRLDIPNCLDIPIIDLDNGNWQRDFLMFSFAVWFGFKKHLVIKEGNFWNLDPSLCKSPFLTFTKQLCKRLGKFIFSGMSVFKWSWLKDLHLLVRKSSRLTFYQKNKKTYQLPLVPRDLVYSTYIREYGPYFYCFGELG